MAKLIGNAMIIPNDEQHFQLKDVKTTSPMKKHSLGHPFLRQTYIFAAVYTVVGSHF